MAYKEIVFTPSVMPCTCWVTFITTINTRQVTLIPVPTRYAHLTGRGCGEVPPAIISSAIGAPPYMVFFVYENGEAEGGGC